MVNGLKKGNRELQEENNRLKTAPLQNSPSDDYSSIQAQVDELENKNRDLLEKLSQEKEKGKKNE